MRPSGFYWVRIRGWGADVSVAEWEPLTTPLGDGTCGQWYLIGTDESEFDINGLVEILAGPLEPPSIPR